MIKRVLSTRDYNVSACRRKDWIAAGLFVHQFGESLRALPLDAQGIGHELSHAIERESRNDDLQWIHREQSSKFVICDF